ncbi:unnamed protein product [Pleuronectes platessa]|uniref:Uncharacterized protein n=1 Tax=Pleuronectes platessa TaxID=8262 RepID=A0A9N7U0L9_PLEPL|nr:unnamed protein product [Pleuronectes platessa]
MNTTTSLRTFGLFWFHTERSGSEQPLSAEDVPRLRHATALPYDVLGEVALGGCLQGVWSSGELRKQSQHRWYQKFCTWSCWPVSKQEVPAGVLPATKLDVTEVQWDLSWMEMSKLLEKDSYCGT